MTTYLLRPGLQILLWSVFITFCINHFVLGLNPFLGSVCSILLLIAVIIQLVLLRKNGLAYIGMFLVGLVILTTVLLYLDNQIFDHYRRYYSHT
jgi:hypothetical protein